MVPLVLAAKQFNIDIEELKQILERTRARVMDAVWEYYGRCMEFPQGV
jgi:hypothetical protein